MRMLNKVAQRPLLVIRKATVPSAVMRSRQEKRSKGAGLYKWGRGSCDMESVLHHHCQYTCTKNVVRDVFVFLIFCTRIY